MRGLTVLKSVIFIQLTKTLILPNGCFCIHNFAVINKLLRFQLNLTLHCCTHFCVRKSYSIDQISTFLNLGKQMVHLLSCCHTIVQQKEEQMFNFVFIFFVCKSFTLLSVCNKKNWVKPLSIRAFLFSQRPTVSQEIYVSFII